MTILNTVEHNYISITGYIIIGAAVSFIAFGALMVLAGEMKARFIVPALIAGLVFGSIVSLITVGIDRSQPKTKIEALIDDDTAFTEIIRDYELIETRGDIYVLKVKEHE